MTVAVARGLVQPLRVQVAVKVWVPVLMVETAKVVLLPPAQVRVPPAQPLVVRMTSPTFWAMVRLLTPAG